MTDIEALNKTLKSNKELSPVMYKYLEGLRSITPDPKGNISCDEGRLKEIISLGSKVSFNLKSGLLGIGNIIDCLDQGKFAISLGWLISNISDMLLALDNIETNLVNCLKGQPWPNVIFDRSEFSFTSFLTQLPYTHQHSIINPNSLAIENLLAWCRWQEGCQPTNVRYLHDAIGSAKNSNELEFDVLYLGNLIAGEWSALVEIIFESESAATYILNDKKVA